MLIAIRKRSWEEHVTHPSGLQYSYDDLDLVCCHGVDSDGLRLGSGTSKQGRRTRCASMPESCHRLTTDGQARLLTDEKTFAVKNDTELFHLKQMDHIRNVPLDFQESVCAFPEFAGADSSLKCSETEHLPVTDREGFLPDCCSIVASTNSLYAKERNINDEIDIATASHTHIHNNDNVFKNPDMYCGYQQCISISTNNEAALFDSAGDQPGNIPRQQETKENHTEGYCRPPEISEATRIQPSATEMEPQSDLPDVEEENTSTFGQSDRKSPICLLDGSAVVKDLILQAVTTGFPDMTVKAIVERDNQLIEELVNDASYNLNELSDESTQNEDTRLAHLLNDVQEGEDGLEIGVFSSQKLKDNCNDARTAVKLAQEMDSVHEECCEDEESVRHGLILKVCMNSKYQCCSASENDIPLPILSTVNQEEYSAQFETRLDVKILATKPESCFSQELLPEDCHDQDKAGLPHQKETNCLKLDIIQKSQIFKANNPQRRCDSDTAQISAGQQLYSDDKSEASKDQNSPPSSAEVNQALHGNQAFGCYCGNSPALEVADGHREHYSVGATVCRMKKPEQAEQLGFKPETSCIDAANKPESQKENPGIQVRMRKQQGLILTSGQDCLLFFWQQTTWQQPPEHSESQSITLPREHARLDSMVLLLMKLDQLDQEIENALSATSSMDSTPTLQRRHPLELNVECLTASSSAKKLSALPNATHSDSALSELGAKPKSGSTTVPEKDKPEIEAKEACTWLRAAGFPQYAQLYEDAQFPIDISSVTGDHDFLDRDSIEALCRRLNTLNKCALMRLEISPQRKRSEDSDEDELCAISGRWTFQRDSKRWSRMEELDVFSALPNDLAQATYANDQVSQNGTLALREGNSTESVLTDLSEQPEVGSIHSSGSGGRGEGHSCTASLTNEATAILATRASSVASMCSSVGTGGFGCANEDSLSDGLPPSPLENLRHFTFDMKTGIMGIGGSLDREGGTGKSTRSRAKSFLKRMESLRLRSGTSSKRKKKGSTSGGKIEISGPVIKEGLDDDKLQRLNCVDISSINFNQNLNHYRNPTQTMTLNRNRSLSYSTQTSNGSTGSSGSSQSEASSGSAVSTPSPVTRARSHSTAAGSSKRGGMYLEGFDPFSILQQSSDRKTTPPPKSAPPISCKTGKGMTVDEQNHRNSGSVQGQTKQGDEEEGEEEDGMIFFFLPEGHKPGTFPKALQDGSCRNNNGNDNVNSVILRGRQSRRHCRGSSGSIDSRLSFYDNVPYTEREGEEEGDEHKLEEVLQHVSGLQRFVNAWSEAVAGEEDEEDEDEEEEGDSDSALDSASPCPSSPLQNRLEEAENGSDQDSTGNPLGEGEEGMRERRDSGVGASLTRTSRPQKLRWPSFQNSHRPSLASAQLQISCQSVLQMNLLQKLSLLQLTALLEKHTPTNKHGFSWAVPKFMKRIKVRDYKDRNVFGVPLQVIVQRTGQPLPQGIQQAMRYLRNQCLDQVGLFRKSGVKSRIQALRQMNETSGADGGGVNYEGQSAYDVADMLKQYFRDLPEPLLTSKLSDTFLQIYQYMPKELRLQAARAAVLLLPDENREALRTLLCLLSDVTASVAENQMTPTNLAVCLAPSLFHLNTLRRKESSSPRVMNRKQMLGKPDQKDLNENLAATHGLAHMIQECRKLFRIPEEMNRCRNSYMEQALLPQRMEELSGEAAGQGSYRAYLQDSLDVLLKEAKDKFKGYDSCSTPEHADLAYRKVHDGFPLRLWKVTVEVPASPEEVLTRLLREQGHWDEDLLESRVVESLDERTEIYQYVRNTMAPLPTRDHLVLRTWLTDLPKGACALVCTSVDHEGAPVVGVRANVLTSRYFMEPCGTNKSRLTHISRIDCRGRFPEWYNKLYGHLCAAEVARIRDSFSVTADKQ